MKRRRNVRQAWPLRNISLSDLYFESIKRADFYRENDDSIGTGVLRFGDCSCFEILFRDFELCSDLAGVVAYFTFKFKFILNFTYDVLLNS